MRTLLGLLIEGALKSITVNISPDLQNLEDNEEDEDEDDFDGIGSLFLPEEEDMPNFAGELLDSQPLILDTSPSHPQPSNDWLLWF